MFVSPTRGEVDFDKIPDYLLEFFEKNKAHDSQFAIIVGSDSQNFDYTKSVTVISIICFGHGGIFFYEKTKEPLLKDVRSKLYAETQHSLQTTMALIDLLEGSSKYKELYDTCPISIHVDAGNSENGKTAALIPEIVGWVRSSGYDCHVKPDSFVASSIADKISK